MILGPVIMWTYIWLNISESIGDSPTHMGPGFVFLWMAFVLKILVSLTFARSLKQQFNSQRGRGASGQLMDTSNRVLAACETCVVVESIMCCDECLDDSGPPLVSYQ